jgi:DNA-binding Lrp family transcriptional regulator
VPSSPNSARNTTSHETALSDAPAAPDELDRQIAAVLQLTPRASLRQIAAFVDSTESTVKRRVERLLTSRLVRTTVLADSLTPGFRVLVQIVCDFSRVKAVGQALAERDDTRFVALVTGPFDVVVELVIPSYRRLSTIILEEFPAIPGINHTTTETVVRNFKTAYDWSRGLLDSQIDAPSADQPVTPPNGEVVLDEVDCRILQELEANGRASYAELADRCDITESTARRRAEHLMTRAGVRPIVLVDPAFLGYQVEMLVWLRIDLSYMEEIAQSLAAHQEVRYVSAASGYSDLVCEIILRSPTDTYEFLSTGIGSLPGIREVNIASELVTLKRASVLY